MKIVQVMNLLKSITILCWSSKAINPIPLVSESYDFKLLKDQIDFDRVRNKGVYIWSSLARPVLW